MLEYLPTDQNIVLLDLVKVDFAVSHSSVVCGNELSSRGQPELMIPL